MQQALNPPVRLETLDRALVAPSPLGLWHLLSLDAPTVALAWSLGFAKATGVRLPQWVPVLLVFVTWCIYISDRLLDVRSALRSRQMHRLRQRHHFSVIYKTADWSYCALLSPNPCQIERDPRDFELEN